MTEDEPKKKFPKWYRPAMYPQTHVDPHKPTRKQRRQANKANFAAARDVVQEIVKERSDKACAEVLGHDWRKFLVKPPSREG